MTGTAPTGASAHTLDHAVAVGDDLDRDARIMQCIRALAQEYPYYAPMVAEGARLTIREGKDGRMPRMNWGTFVTVTMGDFRVTLLESTTGEFSPWTY